MLVWIVSTCLLVLVCLALRQLLRGRVDPRLTYGLWLLVALRVLIPFSPIHSPVSVDGLVEQTGLEERVAQARYAPVVVSTYGSNEGRRSPDDYIDALEEADWFQQSFRETYDSIAPVQILSAEEVTPQEAGKLNGGEGQSYMRLEVLTFPDHFGWLRWLWVGGMAVTAAALLITNLRFYRRLKRCREPYEEALPLPSSLPVYVAPFLPSPCLFGLLRPAIYLNTAALEADNLHHILLHEHIHHRHRDHLWAALRSLCLVIQWFNPLVWLAAHLSRRDCELACDAAVIRALGEEQRLAYGKTLVDMVARSHTPGQLLHTATTMTSGRRSLQERVTLIAKGHRMTALTLAAVLLISAVAAGCAFASAPAAQEDAPAPQVSAPQVSAPAHSSELQPTASPPAVSAPFPSDPEAAARIQAAYEAITADSATPWQLEVNHPQDGIYRCGITAANGYNVQYVGRKLPSFHWQPVSLIGIDPVSAVVPDGTPSLTLSRGNIFIRAYDNAEQTGTPLVLVRMDGAEHWLTATPTELHQNDIYTHLLHLARDAVSSAVRDSIRVDGSITDYEAVAADFARQMAANYRALPSWSEAAALDVQVRSTHVFDAYFGKGENFCAGISLWVKVADPVTAHYWQAGAGLSEQGTGQFADYWRWGAECLFRRDENGDWYCSNWGTGGYSVLLPEKDPNISYIQHLVDCFLLTAGHTHEWIIPSNLLYDFADDPSAFLYALESLSAQNRAELLYRMGYAATTYHDRAHVEALFDLLPEKWHNELALEFFERDGLVLAVHSVREVRTETMLDHGVTPHEYTVFVLEPGAVAFVWEAGLSDPAYTEDGQPHPQYAYLRSPLDQRERITEALTLRELTPDVQGVIHLEASLYVLRFEYAEP